jgi:meiotically up-regulated gene 157 (Mug157) protein
VISIPAFLKTFYSLPWAAAFLTPANAMLSVELTHLADLLDAVKLHDNATFARKWSKTIKEAIHSHALSDGIFAYETNGYGGRYIMDDANVPVGSFVVSAKRPY